MSVETGRSVLIQEGDEEVVRRQQEERRRKRQSPDPLSTAVSEAIEAWIDFHAREQAMDSDSEAKEPKQATSAQVEVTEDSHDDEPFHLKSKIGVSRPDSTSLRATVPEGIVVFLDLKAGDKLEWKMEIVNDQRVAIVKKVSQS